MNQTIAPGIAASQTPAPQPPGEEWRDFSSPCDAQGRPVSAKNGAGAQAGASPTGYWASALAIEGMYCPACSLTVEEALLRVPGVEQVQVNGVTHRARVIWREGQCAPSQWQEAVAATGYKAIPVTDGLLGEQRKYSARQMLWRWLVAGFCMMQVMMYAWPAYVAAPGEMGQNTLQLLRWASWVLSLPVLFFSCGPFFGQALRDLRRRRIGMDLPVSLAIVLTFMVSSAGTFDPGGVFGHDVYFDSLTMFVFLLLGGRWLELRLRNKVAGALDALANRLPEKVERLSDPGNLQSAGEQVALRRLRPGDVVRIKPGECFPGDGNIIAGSTWVDEALLTGESRPLARSAGQDSAVIAGSYNRSHAVTVRLARLGQETRYAQIAAMMDAASQQKPRLAQTADRIAGPFLLAVIALAALAMLFWWPSDPARAVMVGVAVLVVTCPCALALAMPAALLASAGALARHGVLVRNLAALEPLARADMVVFDKTGTLTHDRMTLAGMAVRDGTTPQQALALAGKLAGHSLHPVSRAIAQAHAQAQAPAQPQAAALAEDGEFTQVQEFSGQGIQGLRDGRRLRLGSARFCQADAADADAQERQIAQARAVLADDNGWLASFVLEEEIRPDAARTLAQLEALGLEIAMLSGDQNAATRKIADRLGIRQAIGTCSPEAKLGQIEQWQRQGRRIIMVGDGLNDGPVLASADASFAFGEAVPLTQAQADLVVGGSQLIRVAQSVALARKTLRVVRENLGWALLYNLCFIPMALAGWMPAWLAGLGMAASSLLVMLNAARLAGWRPPFGRAGRIRQFRPASSGLKSLL